jgi:hypothetical protein
VQRLALKIQRLSIISFGLEERFDFGLIFIIGSIETSLLSGCINRIVKFFIDAFYVLEKIIGGITWVLILGDAGHLKDMVAGNIRKDRFNLLNGWRMVSHPSGLVGEKLTGVQWIVEVHDPLVY